MSEIKAVPSVMGDTIEKRQKGLTILCKFVRYRKAYVLLIIDCVLCYEV